MKLVLFAFFCLFASISAWIKPITNKPPNHHHGGQHVPATFTAPSPKVDTPELVYCESNEQCPGRAFCENGDCYAPIHLGIRRVKPVFCRTQCTESSCKDGKTCAQVGNEKCCVYSPN